MDIRIGVITIVLNEQKFIRASLSSVIKFPNVVKVAVVEGAVKMYPVSDDQGLSVDETAEEIVKTMKMENGNKIIFEQYGWADDKSELRNRALKLLGKDIDYVLVVDADEVWDDEGIYRLVQKMREQPTIGVFYFPFYHFWKQKDLIAVGSQWDKPLFRCFKFEDKTLHWEKHEAPVVNQLGIQIDKTQGETTLPYIHVYHYGAMKSKERVLEKLKYYKERDSKLHVIDTWSIWKPGDETQWTHGGGTVEKFTGVHPKEVRDLLN